MTDTLLKDDRRGAVFSDDRTFRYRLWRTWDVDKPTVAFIMLNPSTADETEDDPTIRRCIGYAKDWGYGRLLVGNLFARRATDPSELWSKYPIVGPENDGHLQDICDEAEKVIAAWGAYGYKRGNRATRVAGKLDADLYALDTTHSGQPRHPLYLPADATPALWTTEELD